MRRLGLGILAGLLLSSSALSSAAKAEDVEPCENLSRAFHHFAMNKDKGVSLQQQSEMMDLSKKDDTEISTCLASSTLSMRCLNLVLVRSNQPF